MTIQWGLAAEAELIERDLSSEGVHADVARGLDEGEAAVVASQAVLYGLPDDLTSLGERLVIEFSERERPEIVESELEPGDALLGGGEAGIELAGGLLVIDTPEGLAALGSWLLATYGGATTA